MPARARKLVRVFPPSAALGEVACYVSERAWKGHGVRVWVWPDTTLAVGAVGSPGDALLLRSCFPHLFATYARHGIDRGLVGGDGPQLDDVLDELGWARAHA